MASSAYDSPKLVAHTMHSTVASACTHKTHWNVPSTTLRAVLLTPKALSTVPHSNPRHKKRGPHVCQHLTDVEEEGVAAENHLWGAQV